jgi:hypothetical protein
MIYLTEAARVAHRNIEVFVEEAASIGGNLPNEDCQLLVKKLVELEVMLDRAGHSLRALRETLRSDKP